MKGKVISLAVFALPILMFGSSGVAQAQTIHDTATVSALHASSISNVNRQQHGGLLIKDMSKNASNVNLNQSNNSSVTVTSAFVQGSSINVSLSVDEGGNTVPLNLNGSLFTSPTNSNIYGAMTDQTGQYNVLRFEIVKDASKDFVLDKQHSSGTMLVMTLEKAGTRDISFYQIPLNSVFSSNDIQNIFSNYDTLPVDQHYSDANWMAQLFTPVTTTTKTAAVKQSPAKQPNISSAGAIQPNTSSQPYYWSVTYNTQYSGGAQGTITDSIELGFNVQVPTGWGGGTWTNETLSVASTAYYESATGQTLTNYTNWQIGKATGSVSPPNPFGIGIGVQAPSPDYFMGAQAHGQLAQSGSIQVQFSYGLAYKGFGVTVSYTPGTTTTIGGPAVFPTGGNTQHWGQIVTAGNGTLWMNAPGQQYTASLEVGHLTGQPASASNEYMFTYDLWNWNTGDHGMQTQVWNFNTTD